MHINPLIYVLIASRLGRALRIETPRAALNLPSPRTEAYRRISLLPASFVYVLLFFLHPITLFNV